VRGVAERFTVLIPDRLEPPADVEERVFGESAEIQLFGAKHAFEIPDTVWAGADAVLGWHELEYTADVIAKLERCRVLVRCGSGVDNVDLTAAAERALPVCNVPDYGTTDVADHAMAFILTLARGVFAFSEGVRASNANWSWRAAGELHRLRGSTLGIVGLGRIGTAVARRAQAFEMRIVSYDPYVEDGYFHAVAVERAASLDELLPHVDAVTFHAPLTPETWGMANDAFFERLKPGAIIVNTARGPIIQLDALARALESGRVRAAGLDVVETEPLDDSHPLIRSWRAREPWIAHRLVITPHAAFFSEEAYEELRRKAASTAFEYLTTGTLRNCVNEHLLVRRA
jgi:phosphoglycerate dehydrogenase-like enzyme